MDSVYLCMDANYELGADCPQDPDARGPLLHLFMRDHGLSCTIPNTFTWSNTRGARSSIDFVAYRIPRMITLENKVYEVSDAALGSDHRAVSVTVQGLPHQRPLRRARPDHRCGRWSVDPTKALQEANALAEHLDLSEQDLSESMLVSLCQKSSKRKTSHRYSDSPQIKNLIRQRKQAQGREKRDLAIEIARQRSSDKKAWLHSLLQKGAEGDYSAISYFRRRQTVAFTQATFVMRVGGVDNAVKQMKHFYREKYTPPESSHRDGMPMAMYISQVGRVPGPQLLTAEEIVATLEHMKAGKSAGRDGMTYEFLKVAFQSELQDHILDYLNQILIGAQQLPESWLESQTTFLPKTTEPSKPADLRPIVLSPVISKIFTKIMLVRLRPLFPPLGAGQIGCVPGRQVADGAATVVQALNLAREWGKPLLICKLDITQAFDHLDHCAVARFLSQCGPSREAHLLLQLVLSSSVILNVAGFQWKQRLHRGILQGSAYSAELFARTLDFHMTALNEKWRCSETTWLGNADMTRALFMILFADDLLLLATSYDQLRRLFAGCARYLAGHWAHSGGQKMPDTPVASPSTARCANPWLRHPDTACACHDLLRSAARLWSVLLGSFACKTDKGIASLLRLL